MSEYFYIAENNIITIQHAYRGYKYRLLCAEKVVQIQRIVRGFLVRISERYILSKIYSKVPPFWKGIIESAPISSSTSAVTAGKIQELLKTVQSVTASRAVTTKSSQTNTTASKKPIKAVSDVPSSAVANMQAAERITRAPVPSTRTRGEVVMTEKPSHESTVDRPSKSKKMAFWLPSAFDGAPYISLYDGKHIDYFRNQDNKIKNNSLHHYALHLWPPQPIIKKASEPVAPIDIYDPHEFTLNIHEEARHVLLCERCSRRFRLIHCQTCLRGFCFHCAILYHTERGRRAHDMKFINPQVVSTRVMEKSLVYHIDMANNLSHDLRHIVKNMHNRSEVVRIRKEKELKEEMERLELQKQQALEKALTEDRQRHEAANLIASLYHFSKAKKRVVEKSLQNRLEKLVSMRSKLVDSAVRIQKFFRLYSTRVWIVRNKNRVSTVTLKRRGSVVVRRPSITRGPSRRGSLLSADMTGGIDLDERLAYEITQRRKCERTVIVSEMCDEFTSLTQTHQTNIDYWIRQSAKLPKRLSELESRRNMLELLHKNVLASTVPSPSESPNKMDARMAPRGGSSPNRALVIPTAADDAKTETLLKGLRLSITNIDHLIDNCNIQKSWIAQTVRAACRRLSIMKERFIDTTSRLAWVSKEQSIVSRIVLYATLRMKRLEKANDSALAVEWLRTHYSSAMNIMTTLDAQQESIVLDELQKLKSDEETCHGIDLLLANLNDSINQESQYSAERVYLDKVLLTAVKGSDEAVQYTDQAYKLKKKQSNLIANVIDALKLALQSRLNEEDEANLSVAGFPTDDPKLAIDEMPATIHAVLLNKFKNHPHYNVIDFVKVYWIQPWLSKQAVEDVRIEDDIIMKELDVDSMQNEVKALKEKIRLEETQLKTVDEQVTELQEELDYLLLDPPKVRGDEEVAALIREETIQVLKQELKMKTLERDQLEMKTEKMKTLIEPASIRINGATAEIVGLREQLLKKAAERKRLEDIFFDFEDKTVKEMIPMIDSEIKRNETQLSDTTERLAICQQWMALAAKYSVGELSVREYNALSLPMRISAIDDSIRECTAASHPRLACAPESHRNGFVETTTMILELDLKHLKFVLSHLETEATSARSFKKEREASEKLLLAFQESLLMQRRQKSLQKELDERRHRLEDMRIIRMKQMRADRDALLAAEEAKKKRKAKKITDGLKNSKIVRRANKLRNRLVVVKDNLISAITGKEPPLDAEQARMMDTLRDNGKDNLEDKPQAIRNIKITVGDAETEKFQRQMELLLSKKLPYYIRNPKSIGKQVSVWCQYSFNARQFITSIELGHTNENHPHYKDLTGDGYEAIGHPTLRLLFWVKRDPTKLAGIKTLDFAFSEIEEKCFVREDFELIGPSLFEYDLPDSTVWVNRIQKVVKKATKANISVATNNAIRQLNKTRKLMEENPENKNLRVLEQRFIEELEACYKKEEQAVIEDPIIAAKNLMALDDDEIESWIDCFERVDTLKLGRVKVEDIFQYLQEYMTEAGRMIFTASNAVDEDGYLEFGDFMLSVGIFCFFGAEEVLKFLYTNFDQEKRGMITQGEYIEMLNDLHPFDKSRAVRALKVQKTRATDTIPFAEFVSNNNKFPAMLFPFFRIQRAMRSLFMGDAWWIRKLTKYQDTRAKMVNEADVLDRRAEAELKNYDENEARKKRMDERARAMQQETSAIKLAIMNARQFTDALKN